MGQDIKNCETDDFQEGAHDDDALNHHRQQMCEVAAEVLGVEAGCQPNQGYLKRDSVIKREEDQGKIEFLVVKNDKKLSSMRHLIDLKNIVAK